MRENVIQRLVGQLQQTKYAGVAQLVRVPACHAGGREFKSRHSRHFHSPDMKVAITNRITYFG